MKYLYLTIGEIIDYKDSGIKFLRTYFRDKTATYEDNYYYLPLKCYCNSREDKCEDGYTYQDEYGDCDYCLDSIRTIYANNSVLKEVNFSSVIENILINIQSGRYGIPSLELLQSCGELHYILETGGLNDKETIY